MKRPSNDTGKITRSAGKVGVAVFCSRILGLVREQVFAALFGAGLAYDAFVVAFRIPNLLRDLFGEGALSAAFVAVFSDYDQNKGAEATWRLANNVLIFFSILLSVITLAGMFFAEPLVRLLAPDFAQVPSKVALTSTLTMVMFPFLVFISLAAVVMGILNSKGHFFIPSLASSFFNMGSIVSGGLLALILPRFGYSAILGMAIGTLVGGLLQLGVQIPSLLKTGFSFRPHLDLRDPGLLRILRLMVPAVVGLSATQINIFINTNFAASCAQGSVSWLNYAFRLVQFPIGVFGVALSIATLPVVARYAAVRDMERLKETYLSSLTLGLALSIPASVGLFVLAVPIIRVIFEHGVFTALDTAMTAEALAFFSLGLFAYSIVKIVVPVFYALDDTRVPVLGSFLAVAANVFLVVLTIDHLQHRAVALSTSGAMIFNSLFLNTILYRKLGGFSLSYLFKGLAKVLLASAVMGVWLVVCQFLVGDLLGHGTVREVFGLTFSIGSASLLYGGVLYGLRLKELALLVDKVRERLLGGA